MSKNEQFSDDDKSRWDTNAGFWNERMGEGNEFHKTVIEPVQDKLIGVVKGMNILEIACGNGQYSRHLAERGAHITACDLSEKMIENARERTDSPNVTYLTLDCTSSKELGKLTENSFDAAVCTMAFMDIHDLVPLSEALPKLLKPNSFFIFSQCHPCFNSGSIELVHEQFEVNGRMDNKYSLKISRYGQQQKYLGEAMTGQPVLQNYYHRPLHKIFQPFFDNGFVLDAFEEPQFPRKSEIKSLWKQIYQENPPAIVIRFRLIQNL